ncbi:hypothetical protein BpHYR1_040796 [Brachionus plicatilis]|uniref:Uncharacterized protein n=1 Tax=Brachionus plicatilis TaxID=10195 RepID=A0A3M7RK46_BRAPC|nr:hypothetical protein BpHYR1_040796 [Brachionus plicatilis]
MFGLKPSCHMSRVLKVLRSSLSDKSLSSDLVTIFYFLKKTQHIEIFVRAKDRILGDNHLLVFC